MTLCLPRPGMARHVSYLSAVVVVKSSKRKTVQGC